MEKMDISPKKVRKSVIQTRR